MTIKKDTKPTVKINLNDGPAAWREAADWYARHGMNDTARWMREQADKQERR